ncbi:hypothetical protein FLM9_248 [Candidatus Synechococcus spongiarum]|uniref:Uncharacterized protein n=1 Tax=Candidatus Synechococcus spongiarum TaxID=431041 RepID=A0A164YV92_9SYNE|nr:hypothetical protein FLM9_248 [Candidatus Synechococcus spongiarum]
MLSTIDSKRAFSLCAPAPTGKRVKPLRHWLGCSNGDISLDQSLAAGDCVVEGL